MMNGVAERGYFSAESMKRLLTPLIAAGDQELLMAIAFSKRRRTVLFPSAGASPCTPTGLRNSGTDAIQFPPLDGR
jgi:hypothetical protein